MKAHVSQHPVPFAASARVIIRQGTTTTAVCYRLSTVLLIASMFSQSVVSIPTHTSPTERCACVVSVEHVGVNLTC